MNEDLIRIGWFIPPRQNKSNYDRVLASVWIRCLHLIEPLQKLGYHSYINQPLAPLDIAVFLRAQGPWAQRLQQFLQWRGVKTVFTAVVNYYELSGNLAKAGQLVSPEQIRHCVSMTEKANAVIAVSKFIQNKAVHYNPNSFYVPDSAPGYHFNQAKPAHDFDRSPLRLIWAGQSSKAHTLDTIMPGLQQLPVKLTIVAEKPPELAYPFDFVEWHYQSFPHSIIQGDICISPRLIDNSYDQGHSNFKIMVFLAQGVPVLASPQDSYQEVIRDGYNGYICQQPEEWFDRLTYLLHNRSHLKTMSEHATLSARPYLTENILPVYDDIFRQLKHGRTHISGGFKPVSTP